MMEGKGVEEVGLRLDAPDFQLPTVQGLVLEARVQEQLGRQHRPVYTSLGAILVGVDEEARERG